MWIFGIYVALKLTMKSLSSPSPPQDLNHPKCKSTPHPASPCRLLSPAAQTPPYILPSLDATVTCINVLVFLPVYVLVLWKGFRQLKHGSSTSASHSEDFIYNSVILEIISVFGLGLYCYSIHRWPTDVVWELWWLGIRLWSSFTLDRLSFTARLE